MTDVCLPAEFFPEFRISLHQSDFRVKPGVRKLGENRRSPGSVYRVPRIPDPLSARDNGRDSASAGYHLPLRENRLGVENGGCRGGKQKDMSTNPSLLAAGLVVTTAAMIVGASLQPVEAKFQEAEPIKRPVVISITPTNRLQTPKAHWGIYATAEYRYSVTGKMTATPRKDLIVEEDMFIGQGGNRSTVSLNSGEYEIHIQPDKSRTIVKKFIVNNLSTAPIALSFNVTMIESDEERKKTELVQIGPSLQDMEARLSVLEKKAGIAGAVSPE